MEIKSKTDYCGRCNTYSKYLYGIENYDLKFLNLENYKKYKDFYVYRCPTCGNISVDISNKEDSEAFNSLKNLNIFQRIYDYEYLDGLDLELFENHSTSVPANLYEIYANIQKIENNTDIYIRSLNKSIELKEMIIYKYENSAKEENDEEDFAIFEELNELMTENIKENRKELIKQFINYKIDNPFLYLILIENLIKLSQKKEAEEYFEILLRNYNLEEDLIKFAKNLFKERD